MTTDIITRPVTDNPAVFQTPNAAYCAWKAGRMEPGSAYYGLGVKHRTLIWFADAVPRLRDMRLECDVWCEVLQQFVRTLLPVDQGIRLAMFTANAIRAISFGTPGAELWNRSTVTENDETGSVMIRCETTGELLGRQWTEASGLPWNYDTHRLHGWIGAARLKVVGLHELIDGKSGYDL